MFLLNPNNLPVLALLLASFFVFIRIFFYEVMHPFRVTYLMVTLLVAFGALVGATYYVYIGKQLQEQLDEFRGLNKKLGGQVERLEADCHKLKEISDSMKGELDQFETLRQQMQS